MPWSSREFGTVILRRHNVITSGFAIKNINFKVMFYGIYFTLTIFLG